MRRSNGRGAEVRVGSGARGDNGHHPSESEVIRAACSRGSKEEKWKIRRRLTHLLLRDARKVLLGSSSGAVVRPLRPRLFRATPAGGFLAGFPLLPFFVVLLLLELHETLGRVSGGGGGGGSGGGSGGRGREGEQVGAGRFGLRGFDTGLTSCKKRTIAEKIPESGSCLLVDGADSPRTFETGLKRKPSVPQ